MQKTQQYEATLIELMTKMNNMEVLLVNQRQKSQRLESELSAAQDRIGGAKRRAQLLEAENVKIKGNYNRGMNIMNKKKFPQNFE